MSSLLRLSIPNLAGVFAIALAPLFVTALQPHRIAAPSSPVAAGPAVEATGAQASLNSAVNMELRVVE